MKRTTIIMSLLSVLPFLSCANNADFANAHIVSFYYHFDGTIGGNNHSYQVKIADSVATIAVEELERRDYGEMVDTAGVAFIRDLEELCRTHQVHKYDGFKGYNRYMCDGEGFSLSIRYDNGRSVDAHGMNEFPKGYRDFDRALHALFEPYIVRMRAAALERKKAKGVSGEPTSLLMNFIQRGEAENDSYDVLLYRKSVSDHNIDIKIHSASGEFFPVGDYRYYTAIPDEDVPWDAFVELVRKHDLVQWMDFEQHTEGADHAEWFQLGFSFEEGNISAHGTAHPAHYDAFRHDFLTILQQLVKRLPKE